MRSIISCAVLAWSVCFLAACFGARAVQTPNVPIPDKTPPAKAVEAVPDNPTPAKPGPVSDGYEKLQRAIEAAEKLVEQSSSEIETLKAEKGALEARLSYHRQVVSDLESRVEAKDEDLVKARQESAQRMLRIAAYVMGGLAVISGVLAAVVFTNPLVRPFLIKGSVALGSLASLAWFCEWLVPYLFWVSVAVSVSMVTLAAVYWSRDSLGLFQVVGGIQNLKDDLKAKIPDYRDRLKSTITSTKVRARITALKDRLTKKGA